MAEEEVKQAEAEAPEPDESEQQDQPQETEAEQKARDMGWKPQDEWDGDDDRWMPADEFIRRNERLKSRGDEILRTENDKMAREMSELKKTISDLKNYVTKADKRAMEKARKELEQRQKQAFREGDEAAFDEVQRDLEKLQQEASEVPSDDPKPKPGDGDTDPDFLAWHKQNTWYNNDVEATVYADQAAQVLAARGLRGGELYDAVAQEVRRKFPDKFENTRRSKPAAVEGSGHRGASQPKSKWDQVPKDDRQAFHRFVKQGLFKDTKEDREAFADTYLNG